MGCGSSPPTMRAGAAQARRVSAAGPLPRLGRVSQQPARVITFDSPTHMFGDVPGLGRCELRPASIRIETDLAGAYQRALTAEYRRFVGELIAGCLVSPALTAAQVDALPTRTRTRLRVMVVAVCGLDSDVRRLRGSHLSADERVFAAMLWRFERFRTQLGKLAPAYKLMPSPRLDVDVLRPQLSETQRTLRKLAGVWSPAGGMLAAAGVAAQMRARLVEQGGFKVPRLALDVARLAPTFAVRQRVAPPRVSQLVLQQQAFSWQRNWAPVIERLRELIADQSTDAFVRRWEHSSLWFIFALLTT